MAVVRTVVTGHCAGEERRERMVRAKDGLQAMVPFVETVASQGGTNARKAGEVLGYLQALG